MPRSLFSTYVFWVVILLTAIVAELYFSFNITEPAPPEFVELLPTTTELPSTVPPTPDNIPFTKPKETATPTILINPVINTTPTVTNSPITTYKMLKDVGEPYLDHFGLSKDDFVQMHDAGINLIQGNFDICAYDEDVTYFLDSSYQYGIKVILAAGSGEAEWGYHCESNDRNLQPIWQKEAVISWINKWKSHPSVYAWDISNEAGGNFPHDGDSKYYLTSDQLKQAYLDVKSVDNQHPIMIRMNGWFFYDSDSDFFAAKNPFDTNIADIVMINAYSNVEEYFDDFVYVVMQRANQAIQHISPKTEFIVALGAWREPPIWYLPSVNNLQHDLNSIAEIESPVGVAFFKYGAPNTEWYLPNEENGAPSLWMEIKNYSVD